MKPTSDRKVIAIALLLAGMLALAASLSGGGTLAGFVDSEPVDAQIGAGSFDVRLSEVGPVTADGTTDEENTTHVETTWADYSHATDGSNEVTNTLQIELTEESAAASSVALDVSYAGNDTDSGSTNNTDATAKTLEVVRFDYDGMDLVTDSIGDANGNGVVDLHDAARADLGGLDGLEAGTPTDLTVTVRGNTSLEGDVGDGDGLDFTVTVHTEVRDSWRDAGTSSNNTIQYEAVETDTESDSDGT